jgi:F-type H+-transporting ATPase subunit b
MLIDWFTVGAQAVNFLILVWLLRRYLYRPVLTAIDAREKTIAAKIENAALQETKAQAASEELQKRNEAFDREREALMHKARDEGAAERQRLIEAARRDSELLRSKLKQALTAERAELGRQLSLRTQVEVFAVARKALSDLAGVNLEDRIIEVFIGRLRGLSEKQSLALAGATLTGAALQAAPARIVLVRTAFAPSAEARAKTDAALRECIGANIAVRFETSSDTVCGIEITVDGVKLAWSVADYLTTLAQDLARLAATDLAPASEAPVANQAVHAY